MVIRTAVRYDIDKILPIRLEIHQYHFDLDKAYEPKVNLQESFKLHLASLLQEKNSIVFVAEETKTIVGYALGNLKKPNPLFNFPPTGFVDDIGITATARNKGIGEQLVNALIQWLKSHGAQRIELKVHAQNKAGIAFWTKMGFSCSMQEMYKPV